MMKKILLQQLARIFDAGLRRSHAPFEPLLRGCVASFSVAVLAGEEAPRAEDDDMSKAIRMFERERDGGAASLRMADNGDSGKAERVHEFEDELTPVSAGMIGGHIGKSEARLIEGD